MWQSHHSRPGCLRYLWKASVYPCFDQIPGFRLHSWARVGIKCQDQSYKQSGYKMPLAPLLAPLITQSASKIDREPATLVLIQFALRCIHGLLSQCPKSEASLGPNRNSLYSSSFHGCKFSYPGFLTVLAQQRQSGRPSNPGRTQQDASRPLLSPQTGLIQ